MNKYISKLIGVSLIVVVVICLLMVETTFSSKIMPDFRIKVTKEVTPWPPHLDEELEIVYTVKSKYDMGSIYIMLYPVKAGKIITYLEPLGFPVWEKEKYNEHYKKLEGIDRVLWFTIRKGEDKKFRLRFKPDKKLLGNRIEARPVSQIIVGVQSDTKEHGKGVGGQTLRLYLIDEKTGLLGTMKEVEKGFRETSPELFYDPLQGLLFPEGERVDIYTEQKNKEWIKKIGEIYPRLTKWEKLYLLHDAMHYPIRGKVEMTDLEAAQELLENGWLDAHRAGEEAKKKLLEDLLKKKSDSSERKGGRGFKFFRPDRRGNTDYSVGSDSTPPQRIDITLNGKKI